MDLVKLFDQETVQDNCRLWAWTVKNVDLGNSADLDVALNDSIAALDDRIVGQECGPGEFCGPGHGFGRLHCRFGRQCGLRYRGSGPFCGAATLKPPRP